MKQLLINYTKYNHWANDRVCTRLKNSDISLIDVELKSSFNSIRKTLYHIWDAETIWYKRLNGESLSFWPSEKFENSFDEFVWQFLAGSLLLVKYVRGKSYAELSADLEYSNLESKSFRNRICNIIQHCMNHSTHHRGQLYTMMRTVGITGLQSIDYITFVRENPNE
jgi:uncharacterized damage-inducible protein DinB